MTATIRCANDQDASQVQAVYEPIVAETAISFELQPPDVVEMRRCIGFKLNAWHDVGWWQLSLAPCGNPPEPPHTFAALRVTTGWEDIFVDAAGRIRV